VRDSKKELTADRRRWTQMDADGRSEKLSQCGGRVPRHKATGVARPGIGAQNFSRQINLYLSRLGNAIQVFVEVCQFCFEGFLVVRAEKPA